MSTVLTRTVILSNGGSQRNIRDSLEYRFEVVKGPIPASVLRVQALESTKRALNLVFHRPSASRGGSTGHRNPNIEICNSVADELYQ